MIALGAAANGRPDLAERIRNSSIECLRQAGYREYFDADTAEGCGGDDFSWTAAMAIYWLSD